MRSFPNQAIILNVIFKTSFSRFTRHIFLMLVKFVIFKNLPSILLDSEQKVGKVSKVGFYLMNILMCKFSKPESKRKFLRMISMW
jgi:hypothetical protein